MTKNLYDSRLAKDVMGISEEAEKLQLFGETSTTSKTETVDTSTNTSTNTPTKTPTKTPTNDCISRQDVVEAIEGVDWYHVNSKGELVHGSTSDEESWYKAEDIYKAIESLPPVTPTERNEEDVLKFYYVESLDEYWIGQRCGTRYYGKWTGNCFTFGYSRYLPWGEHVVAPDTLWKEHTYPSEPKEIPFNEWLHGFLEKECQTKRTGEWIVYPLKDEGRVELECPECGYALIRAADRRPHFCENCGAKMKGDNDEK